MFDKSSPIYKSLVNLSQDTTDIHLRDLLNKSRLESFCINGDLLSFDFSKQRITEEVLERLLLIPDLVNLKEAMHELDSGEKLNFSEDKKVSHLLLRKQIFTNKRDIESKAILEERSKLSKFTSEITKMSGKETKFIISIGIGGSRLGSELLSEAFSENKKLKTFYCSSYDLLELEQTLSLCTPSETLVIVSSKSFNTPEVMLNAVRAKEWLSQSLGDLSCRHIYGVSSNFNAMDNFGINKSNQFNLLESVGGRFSVWSSMAAPAILDIGLSQFNSFLEGANLADQDFMDKEWDKNIPVLMALFSFWNNNILNINNLGIFSYDFRLRSLPKYLGQLGMESNGKSISSTNNKVPFATSPLIWGSYGLEAQHSVFQWLLQGNQKSTCDFIGVKRSNKYASLEFSNISLFSQIAALAAGQDNTDLHKSVIGNTPISLLHLREFESKNLGYLLACYEHKIFVEGIIYGINSFDQWGVELGKILNKRSSEDLKFMESYFDKSFLDKNIK